MIGSASIRFPLAGVAVLLFASLSTRTIAAGEPPREWAFTHLEAPAVPAVKQPATLRNPIDAFVLARLEAAGLELNPPAERATLLRRLTYDLTGLAPTPADLLAFLNDPAPDAYEKCVDRLLASPHFGERWAQHWLDVVRYADSEGYKLDLELADAYRYRDYVIRAFNDDLPYDRFVRQQLAGDELEPDNADALVATGFFRLHPEETNAADYCQVRQDILDDITEVFGSTFLGLTLGCARCHNHKFDPIAQKDYFRIQAFFTPLTQQNGRPLVSRADRERHDRQQREWEAATRPIRDELARLLKPVGQQLFQELTQAFDPDTQRALNTPAEQRTAVQKQLVILAGKQLDRRYARMYRRLAGADRARYDELQKQLAQFDALKPPPLPTAMTVCDIAGTPPPTFRLAGGDRLKPREEVQPDFPDFLDADEVPIRSQAASTGRRTALANWLVQDDHPLTSRVIVNRLWQHYLGRGIVGTPNDFGEMGEDPTHPRLLDYLATELVRQGWRLKAIHRLIVTSATYRQASAPGLNRTHTQAMQVDPQNHLLWHARVRRRDAESLRDTVLQISGQLHGRMYGPPTYAELPAQALDRDYAWTPDPNPVERNRRSIYLFTRRNYQHPLLTAFDVPDRVNSCGRRPATVTASQALAMLNGELTLAQARHLADRLAGPEIIRSAYRTVLSREPTDREIAAAGQFLKSQQTLTGSEAEAVVDFCHALLNIAEFLYIE